MMSHGHTVDTETKDIDFNSKEEMLRALRKHQQYWTVQNGFSRGLQTIFPMDTTNVNEVKAGEQPPAGGVADMMSNLSIQAPEAETVKSAVVQAPAPAARPQQAPQTRAPAVTRRSTFHTDKEETAISAPPIQQTGYEGDRSYEISAQDRKDLRSDTINYDAQRMIGHGSFGAVFLAKVVETDDVVAIKKVLQDKRFKNRELQIMRQIAKQPHPYVVALRHHFISKGSKSDDVYLNLVLEYIPETVYSVAKHYNRAKESVPLFSVKLYMYQLCRSLAHIHGMGICHRDIKPQNLLVDPARQVLKLCDFGSAKALVRGEPNVAYICSRYYRAPELIFGSTDYTTAIDVWSAGCVLAELLIGSPIFPGSSGVDQLVEIIKVLGTPTKEQLKSMNPNYQEFKFPQIGAHPWSSIFKPTIPPETVDLVGNLLSYVPDLRCKAIEACGHPFFDDFRKATTRMPDGSPLPEELYQLTPEELFMAPEMEATLAVYPGRGKVLVLPRSASSAPDAEA